MSNPKVTVVMATQGRRPSLRDALVSVLQQTHRDLEVVVVDDAPAGESGWRESESIAPLWRDPRVRLVAFNQSRGCAAAKNAGLRAARGEWVCYLDDDNLYRPEKVEKQLALAEHAGVPLVLCGIEFRAGGRTRRRQVDREEFGGDAMVFDAYIDTNGLFHRREASPTWDEGLRTTDDACFFHALRRQHQLTKVMNVPEALVVYTAHDGVRANSDRLALYRGNRRLLICGVRDFSRSARHRLLLRILVANEKYRRGDWLRFGRRCGRLLAEGGLAEWRVVLNAIGVKIPLTRRWMVR